MHLSKPLLLAGFLALPSLGNAQLPTKVPALVGLRQGPGFWLTKKGAGIGSLNTPPGQHWSWNKELFFRKSVFKGWWVETGIQHCSFSNHLRDTSGLAYQERIQWLQLSGSMYYDVTYPLLGYLVPYFFKMHSYVGISVSPRVGFVRRSQELPDRPGEEEVLSLMTGVHYMHVLPIGKRWWVSSVISFQTIPWGRFSEDPFEYSHPNRTFSWSGGLAYALSKR